MAASLQARGKAGKLEGDLMNSFVSAGLRRSLSVFAASALALLGSAASGHAQVQNKAEQACLTGTAKAGAGVARTQSKQNLACLAAIASGAEIPGGSAEVCVTGDPDGKIAKAVAKTVATDEKRCMDAPGFGYAGPVGINSASITAERDLLHDVFGDDLGAAAVDCASNADGCACQAAVAKAAEASFAATIKTYLKCEKLALKDGADDAGDLDACVIDPDVAGSIAADTKGQLAKKDAALEQAAAGCTAAGASTATLFPGDCSGSAGAPAFADCVEERIECRTCQMLDGVSDLTVDCDLFDDGTANASCVNFPGMTLRTLSQGLYLGSDPMTSVVTADDEFPAAATNWFELVDVGGVIYVRNTGSGKFWRADGSSIVADAGEALDATGWVVFVQSESNGTEFIIVRDGPASSTVDAVKYDSATMSIQLATESIANVLSDPAFRFVME